mmetsp:Transcript_18999/g.55147  ORF Transcript_18999/g.55147 Transcript_18999/m.55147 type:complete len:300 (-) Transcript_18999:227-1126(-)
MYLARISSQFPCGVSGPVYLDGRPTRSWAPRYGMLFRLSADAASSVVRSSMKANFPDVRQVTMGLPGALESPTCSMAFPRKSESICSVISGVVFPMNSSRLILSSADPARAPPAPARPLGRAVPVSSCHDLEGTNGPAYLDGLDTLRQDPRKGMPLRLRARLAQSTVAHSTKANFWLTRHVTMGEPLGLHRPVRRMAPERNWIRSISDVPGGVFPTNNSRFTLSWAAFCAARIGGTPRPGIADAAPARGTTWPIAAMPPPGIAPPIGTAGIPALGTPGCGGGAPRPSPPMSGERERFLP